MCAIANNPLISFFKPAPAIPVATTDPAEIRVQYRRWQFRVLCATIVGYALFYFVRQNLPMAMPAMKKSLGIDYKYLGLFLTLNGVLYGVSKFANGYLGDRSSARAMMTAGLLGSAAVNFCFGFGSAATLLGVVWMFNGWFQGMGYPPCARLMTHWFPPKQLATKMSLWNISHQIGGGVIVVLCGYLIVHWGWRSCFFVPGAIAAAGAYYLWRNLPDTPPSVGLPEVEGTHGHSGELSAAEFKSFVLKKVFRSPYVWLVSFSNFFVYTLRYSIFNWGPAMLTESKHVHLIHAGYMLAAFEWCGLAGALVSGWVTDKFFGGRAMRVGVLYMAMAGVSVYFLWKTPGQNEWVNTALFGAAGFFIYGPQCLVSIAAANLATKRAAATAVGLTSIFGYGSTVLSGWGVGALVDFYHGWDVVFESLLVVAALGVVVFAACWPARAHGYDE
jgi:OPA family glycerol-3-phosphate transporter-like MFS transporter/OPA family sugar phosphate sensor protein UhpC-like MFS transporter